MKQKTIKQPTSLEGVGLHSGAEVKLTFQPAVEDHGIKFQRLDLKDHPVVHADVGRVVSTERSTTIKSGEASISTVEHVLSALAGLEIDNILIQVTGPEVPILDGSAAGFVKALQAAGIVEQAAEREYFIIEEPIVYRDEATGTELMALPHDGFEIVTLIDFGSPILGQQYATLKSIDKFAEDISPCRTFVFLRELETIGSPGTQTGSS
jgi:UDP-3-O-[3-hydroxymyristoyl] N-acetylglucosamine deacetylase / 3-hydroxyacyl-[acyl-carrier-protein] dehydratase